MAAKPRDLVSRFLADVAGFVRGTDQVADALDDTARNLDDVARQGDDTSRKLARAYDRAGDEMRRSMRDSSRDVKTDLKDTGKEAGQEFANNLGQSLSSGDASRVVQDSVGGLIGSLAFAGPIGAAVAAAGAVALGFWNAFSQKTEEQAQRVRDAAATVYQGLIDEGADFAKQYAADVVRQFFDPSTVDALRDNAKAAADAIGTNLGQVLAGGQDSIAAYADKAGERITALQDVARKQPLTGAQADELQRLGDIVAYLDTIRSGWDKATKAVDGYNAALSRSAAYAKPGSSYASGGSAYNSQLGAAAPYATGTR